MPKSRGSKSLGRVSVNVACALLRRAPRARTHTPHAGQFPDCHFATLPVKQRAPGRGGRPRPHAAGSEAVSPERGTRQRHRGSRRCRQQQRPRGGTDGSTQPSYGKRAGGQACDRRAGGRAAARPQPPGRPVLGRGRSLRTPGHPLCSNAPCPSELRGTPRPMTTSRVVRCDTCYMRDTRGAVMTSVTKTWPRAPGSRSEERGRRRSTQGTPLFKHIVFLFPNSNSKEHLLT